MPIADQATRLSIKSAEPASDDAQNGKPSYAVLCTNNKTYQIRQVQTSNSVFVAQAYADTDAAGHPTDGIRAIASCTATLELHPVTDTATNYLKAALLRWDGETLVSAAGRKPRSKADILKDVPLSPGECDNSWAQLCAFEYDAHCYQPTAQSLKSLWRDIVEAAVSESISLGEMFLVNELWKVLESQAMGSVPRPFLEAVLRRLAPKDETIDEDCKYSNSHDYHRAIRPLTCRRGTSRPAKKCAVGRHHTSTVTKPGELPHSGLH